MASVSVDEKLAARLAERAKRAGVSIEQLAKLAIEEYLGESAKDSGGEDGFSFVGAGWNPDVRAQDVDGLLADRFGR